MPVLVLYAAYRLARLRGDGALAGAIAKLFEAQISPDLVEPVLRVLDASPEQRLLPFVRDRVDVLTACAMRGTPNRPELRLFSDAALVDLGYLSIDPKDVRYVHKSTDAGAKVGGAREVLPAVEIARLLKSLQDLDENPASVVVPEDPALLLEVQASMLDARSEKLDGVSLSIVRSEGKGVVGRRIKVAGVSVRSDEAFALSVPADAIMEVHAAALAGQWFELSSPRHRLLAPLPDFTQSGAKVGAWLQPKQAFIDAAGFDVASPVAVPRKFAIELCGRHRWCLPMELALGLEAAQGVREAS